MKENLKVAGILALAFVVAGFIATFILTAAPYILGAIVLGALIYLITKEN